MGVARVTPDKHARQSEGYRCRLSVASGNCFERILQHFRSVSKLFQHLSTSNQDVSNMFQNSEFVSEIIFRICFKQCLTMFQHVFKLFQHLFNTKSETKSNTT